MPRPVHFEIHASNPQALMDFYHALFGWDFNKWAGGDYWLISTGPEDQPGINGGLLPRRGPIPSNDYGINSFIITIDVDDVDASVAKATSINASAVLCMPKFAVAGVGWLAYIRDPDG